MGQNRELANTIFLKMWLWGLCHDNRRLVGYGFGWLRKRYTHLVRGCCSSCSVRRWHCRNVHLGAIHSTSAGTVAKIWFKHMLLLSEQDKILSERISIKNMHILFLRQFKFEKLDDKPLILKYHPLTQISPSQLLKKL